jgi:hypothetical protein
VTLETLLDYFAAEKAESVLFIAAGAAALLAGLAFWFRGAPVLKGAAIPLIAIALIHLVVGVTVFARTDEQVRSLVAQLEQQPAAFKAEESKRMAQVNDNFDLYQQIGTALALAGLGMVAWGLQRARPILAGAGCGLAFQALFTLVLDYFAQTRADVYTQALIAMGT